MPDYLKRTAVTYSDNSSLDIFKYDNCLRIIKDDNQKYEDGILELTYEDVITLKNFLNENF